MGIDISLGGGEKRDRLRSGNQLPRRRRGARHGGRAIVDGSEGLRKVIENRNL